MATRTRRKHPAHRARYRGRTTIVDTGDGRRLRLYVVRQLPEGIQWSVTLDDETQLSVPPVRALDGDAPQWQRDAAAAVVAAATDSKAAKRLATLVAEHGG